MPTISSLMRALMERAFNEGNLAAVDELLSLDSPTHIPGWAMPANRLGLKQMIAHLRNAFPDLQCLVEDEIQQGDKLAALWTMRGSHKGVFLGNAPTGKPVAMQGFIFIRTANGQIVENWILVDQMALLQQLGIVPPPQGQLQQHA